MNRRLVLLLVLSSLSMLLSTTIARAENPPPFVMKWGSRGSGQGQFDNSRAIATNPSGSVVYVVERWNHRIQRFTSGGSYLGEHDSFVSPRGIAVADDGSYYVLDASASTVKKFSSGGSLITQWGSFGNQEGQFGAAVGICVDPSGNVYVADTNNYRIQKFTSNGQFIMSWGEWGAEPGQFLVPRGIASSSNGTIYVADSGNHRVQKFNSNGSFLDEWGSMGADDGQFQGPYSISVDPSGDVYVADTGNHRIQKFRSSGTFLTKWGTNGSGNGQFTNPQGVVVDADGNVYVADTSNYRIQKFGQGGAQTGIVDGLRETSARLRPSMPNPFLNRTLIRYEIEESGPVQLQIFDLTGRLVRSLEERDRGPGEYAVAWNGRNEHGEPVPAGTYFVRLIARSSVLTQKIVAIR